MKLIAFLLLSLFAIIISAGCDSSSCGTTGTCVNSNMCNCGSNYSPTDNTNTACAQGTCTPNDYSQASHLVPLTVYNPTLVSSFSSGAWDINLKYAQAQKVSRNVKIFSATGTLCKEFVDDLGYLDGASLPWDQSIDATNGGSNCLDVIQANLPWTNVSTCLRDGSDPNVYQGNIVTYTSLSGVDYNQTQYSNGAKKSLITTQYTSSKGFSFDFQASITTGSQDYNFTLAYGTIVTMLLNTTSSTSKNASCLLDLFSTTLSYPRNLFLVTTDIDVNSSGFQFFSFLVLDSSAGASAIVGNAIVAYTNATVVSCSGVSTISVNISTDYQQILFRVVSNTFDPSTLKLTLVYALRITAPIKADSTYTTSGDTLSQTTITIGADTCDSEFCDQTVTVVVDLDGMDCNGVSKSSILTMTPVCKTGGIQTLCDSYLAGINGRKINVPIVFAAKWCPIQEKTELSKNAFRIYPSGSDQPVDNGAVISNTRSVTGKITINIDSKVTNSVLGSANITQLVLSDGINPFTVSLASITQEFAALTSTFVVTFNHTIDPAITLINFNNQLFYVATVDAVFSVPGSKKSFIGRKVVSNVVPVTSQSSLFKMGSLASTSTTAPPKASSSSVVEMAMGVWVSMIALFCLMMF